MTEYGPDHPAAKSEDYWDSLASDGGDVEDVDADALTAIDLVLQHADDWAIHGVTLAGRDEDDGTLYLLALRSKVGDSGLLLSLRYFAAYPADRSGTWSRQGVEMVVNGNLTQALLRMLARADTDGLAGSEDDPLALDVTDGEVEDDPDALTGPLAQLAGDAETDPEAKVECLACGEQVRRGDAISVDMGGNEMFRHKGECPDD